MAKVVFVNPPLSVKDRYGVKSQGGGWTPPLGLTNLAAMTRKHGYETVIIDAAAMSMGYEETAKEILDNGFGYVGITAVTISISHAACLANMLKIADKGITTIIGGPHLSAIPLETMSMYPEFDIGVIGEADYTIIDLLHALEEGSNLSQVKGLIIRINDGLSITPSRPKVKNLDELPMPAWDLLPELAKYYCPPVHTLRRIPAALLVASRGCPGECTFCANSVSGKVMRAYSAEYTFEMIKDLYYNYGIREIQLRDDNFTAYRKRMVKLCKILKHKKLNLVWTCAGRVDMVNPTILEMMKEAGCWQIWYGIESGCQSVLNAMKKNITIEQIKEAVHMTRDAGIIPCGFFMLGNPTETKKSLMKTVDFATKLPLGEAHFSFMTPLPGAEIYHRAEELGTFYNEWDKLNGWSPAFVPFGLTVQDLEYYSKKAFIRFYFRPRVVVSYIKKIRSWWHLKFYFLGFVSLLEYLVRRRTNNVFGNKSSTTESKTLK